MNYLLSLAKKFKSFLPILQFNADTALHEGCICLFNNQNDIRMINGTVLQGFGVISKKTKKCIQGDFSLESQSAI